MEVESSTRMRCLFVALLLRCAAAAIGDACSVAGATTSCTFPSGQNDADIVVVHGRREQESDTSIRYRCNSGGVCVDTINKVEIATGIWMPSINLGTWFVCTLHMI